MSLIQVSNLAFAYEGSYVNNFEKEGNIMQIIHNYRHDALLRASFNALAEQTFGLNFENWYQNGFWTDAYDPYSVVIDGRVVANVSLNRTDMVMGGKRRRIYQLGTVMTAPEYRNLGYSRKIMEAIEKDTADADGIYLFGNDSVLEFYPRFGFRQNREFIHHRSVHQAGESRMVNVPMDGPEGWKQLADAMERSTFPGGCRMVDNPGLIFFYVSQFMQGCVYRMADSDIWVIAELEEGELTLHNVFSPEIISLDSVIEAFGSGVAHVTLGFSPGDPTGFQCRELKEEDCTFFTKGDIFRDFEERQLRIPSLSHA